MICCPPCCSNPRSLGTLAAVGAVVYVADQLSAWVAVRIWWIAGTVVLCVALAVVISMMLEGWADRRGARFAERHGILSRADVLAAAAIPRQHWVAEVLPAQPEPARPALGAPPKSWLCETCYWVWPLDVPFCGVCGGSRSAHGAAREVVIRQALNGE